MKTLGSSSGPRTKRGPGRKWRTCFVAAPVGADLSTLRALLEKRGIKAVDASELLTGAPVLERLTSAISKVDLVIAILGLEQVNPNVLFELGLAHGLDKRVLILAPPPLKSLPFDIAGMMHLRAYPDNAEAVGFALDQILAAGKRPPRRPTKAPGESRPIGDQADELLGRLESLGDRATGLDVERIVASAVQTSGISVAAYSDRPDIGADFAIWADGLEASVGNPLLIEVKKRVGGRAEARRLLHQAAGYVERSNSRWLLLVYEEGPPSDELASQAGWPVLFLQVRELIERLRTESLTDIIRDVRNRAVHRTAL